MEDRTASMIGRVINIDSLTEYFQSRQNSDGGFCFYGLDESCLSDTCFAVLCLNIIGCKPKNEEVIDYIREYQEEDGSFAGVCVAWMVLKAMSALGDVTLRDPTDYVNEQVKTHRILDEVYIESQSIFESTFYLADVSMMLGLDNMCEAMGQKIIPCVKNDGSIGGSDPGLASTYFGLAILKRAGISLENPDKTALWASNYSISTGGFSKKPITGLAFMDETYYGLEIMGMLDGKPPYVDETIKFVAGCQNENGGFRRALASGISGFETSYYALESLRVLLNIKYQPIYNF